MLREWRRPGEDGKPIGIKELKTTNVSQAIRDGMDIGVKGMDPDRKDGGKSRLK